MTVLPDLPFGNSAATVLSGVAAVDQALAHIIPSWSIRSERRDEPFAAKVSALDIAGLTLVASSIFPSVMEVDDSVGCHLFVPYSGHVEMKIDGQIIPLVAGANAFLAPNMRRSSINGKRSGVHMRVDPVRLRNTCETLAGPGVGLVDFMNKPQVIELRQTRGLFRSFQSVCRLIDSLYADPASAELLGVDDLIYRWIASGLVNPSQSTSSVSSSHSMIVRIDQVCDMIRSASIRPLTLTDMEQVSGLSSRSLQYGFQNRFGCSPMEWQRRERIATARDRLLTSEPHESITSIAYSLGFSSSAAFAAQYRHYYGESPSHTRRTPPHPKGLNRKSACI